MNDKIWLSSPHLGEAEQQFVKEAFDTNWIAPLGPHVNGFEEDLQQYNGVAHAAALSSGTGAIHLAMRLLGVEPGDYVICQSFTFCGSANPITYVGGVPVFVDSELDSWNMDPVALEDAITAIRSDKGRYPGKIRGIMPVHLYGMPANMDAIMAIAEQYEIPIIEDAAESLGSTYHGKKTGSMGKMGVYSFNGNKIITTSGGGALVSNEEGLIQKARFLATQARDPAPHYQHTEIGFNYRLSNVLAGIGRGQMRVLPKRIEQRRANFERYRQYFGSWNDKGLHVQWQQEPEGCYSNRWLTSILVDPEQNQGMTVEDIRLGLAADNIEARPLWKPMHLQPIYKGHPYFGGNHAEELFGKGLCMPSGSNLSDSDFERIYRALDKVYQEKIG
jgi:dTDP-4-amino-4,6-dideoxygalactose transaminase